ncbi:MAG: nucleotidyltransferase family protein, partial [Nitrospirota bacterium]
VLNPAGSLIGEIRDLLQDGSEALDFGWIFDCAVKNEVAPFLYYNLKAMDNIPAAVLERFRNSYLYAVRKNVINAEEMLRVLRSLEKGGVEAIPLKGSLASEIIFGNPGLYPATDIDILVRRDDLEGAGKIITEAGYSKNDMIAGDLLSSHYHLLYRKDDHYLELHWNLAKRYFETDPEFWWEESRDMEYAGAAVKTLSPERYIMYAIFRLFDHGFRPLKFSVFVYGLASKYSASIDWGKLVHLARTYKMERVVGFTLKLIGELFGTPCSYDIQSAKVLGYDFFKKKVIAGIFAEAERPHLDMLIYTFLLDSPAEFAKVISDRFFPRMSEIRLRYGLPAGSKKAYAYYLANPVLMIIKRR